MEDFTSTPAAAPRASRKTSRKCQVCGTAAAPGLSRIIIETKYLCRHCNRVLCQACTFQPQVHGDCLMHYQKSACDLIARENKSVIAEKVSKI